MIRKLTPLVLALVLFGCATNKPLTNANGVSTSAASERGSIARAAKLFREDQLTDAQRTTQAALKQHPNSGLLYSIDALINEKLGLTGKARNSFEKAIELSPDNPIVRNNFANFLCKSGNYSAAQTNFMLAAELDNNPNPDIAYTNAGLCLKKSENFEQANELFRKAIQINASQVNALYQLSVGTLNNGDTASASAYLSQYLNNADHTAKTLDLARKIELAKGNSIGAEEYASQLKRTYPKSREARGLSNNSATTTPFIKKGNEPSAVAPADNNVFNSSSSPFVDSRNTLLAMSAENFTLQVIASKDIQTINKLLSTLNGADNPYELYAYSFKRNKATWYNVVTGNFNTAEEANSAIASLPGTIQGMQPWVRPIKSIQKVLNQT